MLTKVVLSLALITVASAGRVAFTGCPGNLPQPLWVESDFCTADRCILTRNQVWTGRTEFQPLEDFNTLRVTLTGFLGPVPVPIDIPPGYEDACHFLEAPGSCPVRAGNRYIWAIQAPVDGSYPAAQGVTLELRAGEGTRVVACARVLADIR